MEAPETGGQKKRKRATAPAGPVKESIVINSGDTRYGEVSSIMPMMDFLHHHGLMGPGPVTFLDVGSGYGKVVHEADQWLKDRGLGKALGVEVVEERVKESIKTYGNDFPVHHARIEDMPPQILASISHAFMYDLCFKRSYRKLRMEERKLDPHAKIQRTVFHDMPNLQVFVSNFEPELLVDGRVPDGWRVEGTQTLGPYSANKFFVYCRILEEEN